LDQIDKINNLRTATINHGGSVDVANGKYGSQIETLRKTLIQMGYTKAEVNNLIGRYKAIPGSVYTKMTADTGKASANVATLRRQIRDLHGKTVTITTRFTSSGNAHVSGGVGSGTQVKDDRWGGVHKSMAAGGITAGIYPASNPPLIRFAEPATGGEAYIPRRGDTARSMGILDQAANWYGAQVVPRAAPVGMSRPVVVNVIAKSGDGHRLAAELMKTIRYEVRTAGSVEKAFS
jgi:hypothetical protein